MLYTWESGQIQKTVTQCVASQGIASHTSFASYHTIVAEVSTATKESIPNMNPHLVQHIHALCNLQDTEDLFSDLPGATSLLALAYIDTNSSQPYALICFSSYVANRSVRPCGHNCFSHCAASAECPPCHYMLTGSVERGETIVAHDHYAYKYMPIYMSLACSLEQYSCILMSWWLPAQQPIRAHHRLVGDLNSILQICLQRWVPASEEVQTVQWQLLLLQQGYLAAQLLEQLLVELGARAAH